MNGQEWSGYANRESFAFEVWTANDWGLYESIRRAARVFLRRVPNMTDQTLGRNITDTVRTWVDMADKGEPLRNLGWADREPVTVSPKLLREMGDDIGRESWNLIRPEDVGASWRETLED